MKQTFVITSVFIAGALGGSAVTQLQEQGAVLHASKNEPRSHVFQSIDRPPKGDGWKAHLTSGAMYDKVEALEASAIKAANKHEYGGNDVLVDNPIGCPISRMNFKCVVRGKAKHWEYEFADNPTVTVVFGPAQ